MFVRLVFGVICCSGLIRLFIWFLRADWLGYCVSVVCLDFKLVV